VKAGLVVCIKALVGEYLVVCGVVERVGGVAISKVSFH